MIATRTPVRGLRLLEASPAGGKSYIGGKVIGVRLVAHSFGAALLEAMVLSKKTRVKR